jgi:hypothetical protein
MQNGPQDATVVLSDGTIVDIVYDIVDDNEVKGDKVSG